MDRLALAAANCLVGNALFDACVELGPFGATFTAREGAVRVALSGAPRSADIGGRGVAFETSMSIADGETLTLGFGRGGAFSYLAIEGGISGEPMFGSLAVNARAGLGSPYPRPLQAGGSSFPHLLPGLSASSWGHKTTSSRTRPRRYSSTANGRSRRPAIAWATGWKGP
jgi:allophanate hydrolase subunit 2